MEKPRRKKPDPQCPKCQEELQRHVDLSEAIFDEVDHGVGRGCCLTITTVTMKRSRRAEMTMHEVQMASSER